MVEAWKGANEQVIAPAEDAIPADDRTPEQIAESVKAGRELFYGAKANCVKCHGPTALGDGQQDDYDVWSKRTTNFIEATRRPSRPDRKRRRRTWPKLKGDEATQRRQQILARRRIDQRRAVACATSCRRAMPSRATCGGHLPRRSSADRYVLARVRRHRGHADAGQRTGGRRRARARSREQEMWQIVDYVQSLPFEPASKPQLRPVNTEWLAREVRSS